MFIVHTRDQWFIIHMNIKADFKAKTVMNSENVCVFPII